MVYDKTRFSKKQAKETVSKLQQAIAHPSVSALIYGYLKEKDINLMQMTVDEWKAIEKDIVEIILAEVYPGEDVAEDQLNFTTLARSIAFMSNFIEMLNTNLDESGALSGEVKSDNDDGRDKSAPGTTKFEV